MDILDQVTVKQAGNIRRIRRYFQGVYPDCGVIVRGITGWETVEETDVVVASHIFVVVDINE